MTPRVAVLDDERRMADVVAMLLRREGYDVEAFVEPDALLRALAEEPFDCLVSDLRMPGKDGLEVLRRARALEPDLPVILMTAHGTVRSAL